MFKLARIREDRRVVKRLDDICNDVVVIGLVFIVCVGIGLVVSLIKSY